MVIALLTFGLSPTEAQQAAGLRKLDLKKATPKCRKKIADSYGPKCGAICRETCLINEKARLDDCRGDCTTTCATNSDPNDTASCESGCAKKCFTIARDEALECEQGCSVACTMDPPKSRCESICLLPCQVTDPNKAPGEPPNPVDPRASESVASGESAADATAKELEEACGMEIPVSPPVSNALENCLVECVTPCMADWYVANPPQDPNGSKPIVDTSDRPNISPWERWLRLSNDGRQRYEARGYTGVAIDSFAAGEFNDYVNPGLSGDVKLRGVAGADFAYRIWGNLTAGRQIWFYGKAVYGVRSAEVSCDVDPNGMPKNSDCDPNSIQPANAASIVRNATSLEAYAGLRWEFLPVQDRWSAAASSLYVKAQFGFLTVAGQGGDVIDVRNYAFGSITTNGRFQGSYAEMGYGRTDLFLHHANRRFKLNGYLTWRALTSPWRRPLAQPFVQLTFDGDLGRGSDSVQTYIGVSFDLDRFDPKSTFKLGGS